MRLENLSVMHKPAHFFGCWSKAVTCSGAYDHIKRFGCRKMMRYRAYPAKPLHQNGHFPVGSSLDESFKSPEFDNMQSGLGNITVIIQVNCHFSVAFNPGYGFNG
jgi:hypothetical protein